MPTSHASKEDSNIYSSSSSNIPPDPSPSPTLKSNHSLGASQLDHRVSTNNHSLLHKLSPLQLLDSSPVKIRTINSATRSIIDNNNSSTMSSSSPPLPSNNYNNREEEALKGSSGMTSASSSTAPPPPNTTTHEYPIPSISTHVSTRYEDNFRGSINVREHHESNKRSNRDYDEGVHPHNDYHNMSYEESSSSYSSAPQQPYPSTNALRRRLSIEEGNTAEIQKEQTNLVYGNQRSANSARGSSLSSYSNNYHQQQQQHQTTYPASGYPPSYYEKSIEEEDPPRRVLPKQEQFLHSQQNWRENNLLHNSLPINTNSSAQNIYQKNTATSPSNFSAAGLTSQENFAATLNIQHHDYHGRRNSNHHLPNTTPPNNNHLYDTNNKDTYQVERNNYYQGNLAVNNHNHHRQITTIEPSQAAHQIVGSGYKQATTSSGTNIMQSTQPFVIHPSMQPSSGIPPSFHHQVHSSSSFHIPSNYPNSLQQQSHHHQQQHQPIQSNNYLNPQQQQQQQSTYSSPNSNQANSSEPKLRVYNSTLKVPEGIFSYDGTTLTCEPHGFKPNDRRGAPQTTHSVYVSDVLVVSCDLVNMSNQPGIFQNCTARLVHLMGKNAKKKRKEGEQDEGMDSEDDDSEDVKKKKKKNKKKDQEDSLDGDLMTDFSQAGMLESFELLSEQPCQENVQKGKIVSSLKVPRVRGRDCKTKTGQIQVIRFKGTEREHIIAVSDLFWIRSRTRTEMEVRKFKKQQQQQNSSAAQPVISSQPPPESHLPPTSHNHPQSLHPSISSTLNPPRDNYQHSTQQQWPNIVHPNSPSTNDHAGLPPKKRRGNNSPGGSNTPNSYRAPANPAASIVHASSSSNYFPPNNMILSHHEDGKIQNQYLPPNHHHNHHMPFQPSRNEPTYDELRQRVQMLEDRLFRLESVLMKKGHLSPDLPPQTNNTNPFNSSPFLLTPIEPPKASFTPFPIDAFQSEIPKNDKRENPTIASVVPTESQPALYPPSNNPFDSLSDPFLKSGFTPSPSTLLNPISSSSSESTKREHI